MVGRLEGWKVEKFEDRTYELSDLLNLPTVIQHGAR
jgi:hypothetical protein